ncbi:MAG: hypothetical protein WAL12_21020 [Trebonia sp.]
MSLSFGSASVGTSAAALPAALSAVSPGSLTFYNAGAAAVTLGPSGVTAGEVGPGFATIAAGGQVTIPEVGNFAPNGKLFAISASGTCILNWFNGNLT